ncbi:hypothetical protein lerEdw1_005956 [Lerista edwardsae]|nr:hypothetical protein lerEdw1_005957 [Lerista edwardsae]KAJ6650560.1 hypothetical protein lerEdw1_005956 [Lerista edwardsae]
MWMAFMLASDVFLLSENRRSPVLLPCQGFISEDEFLEITGITREQSGEYECTAINDVAAPDIRRVKVTVNYPPSISHAKNTGASVGQKGILRCEASAVPVAEFQWFKEETRLANGLDGVRIENKGRMSTLTFFNVSEKDYGNYTCVAINKLGNTNASIILFGRFMTRGAEHGGCAQYALASACERTVEAFQKEKPLCAQWVFVCDYVQKPLRFRGQATITSLPVFLFLFFSHPGPGAVHDGNNAASRAMAGLWLSGTLFAHFLLKF